MKSAAAALIFVLFVTTGATTTSPPTASSLPPPTPLLPTTTTTTPPPSELPADEAQLLSLLATVRSRLGELAGRITQLDGDIAANQARLDTANAELATAEAGAAVADGRLAFTRLAQAGALIELRRVAVAAYVHEPLGEMANMMLHLSDPAELVDASSFYKIVVDAAGNALKTYVRLSDAATVGARKADSARDVATRKQKAVAASQAQLESLRQTLVAIQRASTDQQAQQTQLLGDLGNNKALFESELAALVAESDSISALLHSLASDGGTAPTPTGGYFANPVPGAQVTQRFGPNSDPFTGIAGFHPGIDFGARLGTQIHAAGDGTVVFAGEESGYGNYTCINHGHDVATCYGHQSALLVKAGDTVLRGQLIGLVGSTGYSTGPHLHFEVRVSGTPVDPLPWLAP